MGAAEAMPIAFIGFSFIAWLTWFFSSRPRLYLRVFVPRDEWLGVARWAFRDDFRQGMRQMAGLQFGVACVIGLGWAVVALLSAGPKMPNPALQPTAGACRLSGVHSSLGPRRG